MGAPRTSYGVICCRRCETTQRPPGRCLYLLVQRKDSISYVEFLRGKYDIHDDRYIQSLLAGMTPQERGGLVSGRSFPRLWAGVWADRRRAPRGYHEAAAKFEAVRPRLPALLARGRASRAEPEWGFPKGGRRIDEPAAAAALREFAEETGIPAGAVRWAGGPSVVDTFVGSDGNRYRHVFFLASATTKDPGKYDTTEIRDVRWFSYDQALAKLARPGPLVRAAARAGFSLTPR